MWHPMRKAVGAITKSSIFWDSMGTRGCCQRKGRIYSTKHSAIRVSLDQSEENNTILCSVSILAMIYRGTDTCKIIPIWCGSFLFNQISFCFFYKYLHLKWTDCIITFSLLEGTHTHTHTHSVHWFKPLTKKLQLLPVAALWT